MPSNAQPPVIGLIAGQGQLPFMIAQGAKLAGLRVICVGLADNVDPTLAEQVDEFTTVPIARLGCWIRNLKKFGVTDTIMVGRVSKKRMQSGSIFKLILSYLPDWRVLRIYFGRLKGKDKRTDTLLCALADELADGGINLIDSTKHCMQHIAEKGVMTDVQPDKSVREDIEFGWEIVKKIGELDIGQAIAVSNKDIIAVEAIEGTAKMIERAGLLCKKGGWTLIKAAKPNQDLRFDVPCVGVDTIKSLAEHKAKCLVVEADKTIIINKPETIKLANKLKIPIVGH